MTDIENITIDYDDKKVRLEEILYEDGTLGYVLFVKSGIHYKVVVE